MFEVIKMVNGNEVERSRVLDRERAIEVLDEWELADIRKQLGYRRQRPHDLVIYIEEVNQAG
jgi:hypothetical protein